MGQPKGIKVVPQSTRGFHEHYVRSKTLQGNTVFQLSGGQHRLENTPTDTISLVDGFITVTALQFDMTAHETTNRLKKIKW